MKAKSTQRVLPPKFKFTQEAVFKRRPTMMERLQILFGYNLVMKLTVWCEHSPGKTQPTLDLKTTKENV